MSIREFVAKFPGHQDFSRRSYILLFAYYLRKYRGAAEFTAGDIRNCFAEGMLRIPTDLTVLLRRLSAGKGSPIVRARGAGIYALSLHGAAGVEAIVPAPGADPRELRSFLASAVPYLTKVIAKVNDVQRREFLAEAISCVGVGARRATVVLTWLAALDHMYEYVATHHLAAFNAALGRRQDRLAKVRIGTRDDFGEMREATFIEVCRSASIVTHDVRKILDEKLGFRNSCAHPSSIQIGDSKVVSFVEDLVENVITKYPI